MTKPLPRKQGSFLSAVDDIVFGRQKIAIADLIDLIHRVNPTSIPLGKWATEERYRLKSRLQSFLIENYSDLVQATAMPGNGEQFVTLWVRGSGQGACHARLDQLTPAARSWARIQLDTEEATSPVAEWEPFRQDRKKSGGPSEADDLLGRARQALGEYDYEQARELAELAFHDRPEEAAALFLLELLVDHLALFSEALALGDRLAPALRRVSPIRCLLARAATNSGEFGLAKELLHRQNSRLAAESWLDLGQAALAAKDLATAEESLREVTRIDDTLLRFPGFKKAFLAAQIQDRLPQIEKLLQDWRDGALAGEEAEAAARRFQEAGLAHPSLTELLKTIGGQKKKAALLVAIAEADGHFAREEYGLAAQGYATALELGGEERLRERLAEAKDRAQARKEEEYLAGLVEKMRGANLEEALIDYLELSPTQRLRIKERFHPPEMEMVEELEDGAKVSTAKTLVAAALALGKAREAVALGDFRSAFSLLESHKSLLKKYAPAKEVESAALRGLAEERRALSLAKIRQVKETLRQGRAPEAAALLPAIEVDNLQPEEEALLKTYRKRASIDSERLRLERELLENEENAAWPRVRETLVALRELARFEEQFLAKREQAINRRIVRQYRLRYLDLAGCSLHLGDTDYSRYREQCRPWLFAGDETVALPAVHGPWVIIRLLDGKSAVGKGAVVFRVEAGLELMDFMVWEGCFWLAGRRGEVFVVALNGSSLQAVYPSCNQLIEKEVVEAVLLAPPQHLWLQVRDPQFENGRAMVLDLKKRSLREIGEGINLQRLTGEDPLRIFRTQNPLCFL